jgi:hypothetical protein
VSPEREELRRLVEELPDERVAAVLAEVRRQAEPTHPAEPWPPTWFGSINSERTDLARHHDDLLADGFGRN